MQQGDVCAAAVATGSRLGHATCQQLRRHLHGSSGKEWSREVVAAVQWHVKQVESHRSGM